MHLERDRINLIDMSRAWWNYILFKMAVQAQR